MEFQTKNGNKSSKLAFEGKKQEEMSTFLDFKYNQEGVKLQLSTIPLRVLLPLLTSYHYFTQLNKEDSMKRNDFRN